MPTAGDSERPEDQSTTELPAPATVRDGTNATVTDDTAEGQAPAEPEPAEPDRAEPEPDGPDDVGETTGATSPETGEPRETTATGDAATGDAASEALPDENPPAGNAETEEPEEGGSGPPGSVPRERAEPPDEPDDTGAARTDTDAAAASTEDAPPGEEPGGARHPAEPDPGPGGATEPEPVVPAAPAAAEPEPESEPESEPEPEPEPAELAEPAAESRAAAEPPAPDVAEVAWPTDDPEARRPEARQDVAPEPAPIAWPDEEPAELSAPEPAAGEHDEVPGATGGRSEDAGTEDAGTEDAGTEDAGTEDVAAEAVAAGADASAPPAWPPEPSPPDDAATAAPADTTGPAPQVRWPTGDPEPPPDDGAEPAAERTQLLPALPRPPEPEPADTQYLPVVRPQPPSAAREEREEEDERPGERTEMLDLTELGAFPATRDGTAASPADVGVTEPLGAPLPVPGPATERRPAEPPTPPVASETAHDEPPPPPPSTDGGGGGGGKPRRGGRRTALIAAGALVVVVAVAAGVVVWVPGVAARLGLGGAGTVASPPPAKPFSPAVRPVGARAPEPAAAGVMAALRAPASDPGLGTLTGKVIDPASGDTLWQRDPTKPLPPGSSNKILTAAAALLSLDHDTTLATKVVAGREPGTAVLVGGGDPTLSSLPVGERSVYWRPAHLSQLVKQVKRATGGTIRTVYIDTSRYTGPKRAEGWQVSDIEAGNWAPIVPAMLDGGRSNPHMAEGTPRTAHPTRDLLHAFASALGAQAGGKRAAPQGTKVLGVVRSAPLDELVANMLTISDNVLAEALGRQVARSQGMPESFAGAHEAVLSVLRQHGFDTSGTTLADSSGLSTRDRVPARLLASIMSVAARPGTGDPRTAKLRPILAGIPVAGGTGTLKTRYRTGPSVVGKGWVRAKTGTLSGVNTLTGLVTDRDGRVLVFAFMSNGTPSPEARPALDALAAALRGCGCRG